MSVPYDEATALVGTINTDTAAQLVLIKAEIAKLNTQLKDSQILRSTYDVCAKPLEKAVNCLDKITADLVTVQVKLDDLEALL